MNMTSTGKKALQWTCVVLFILLLGFLCFGYFFLELPLFSRGGWNTTDTGAVQYLDYYGRPLTLWQTIDGKKYYFDSEGVQQVGWLNHNGRRYYLLKDGNMHTGWLELDGERYYFNDDGELQTGWLTQGDNRAYLDSDGTLYIGWLELPEGKYLLDKEGKPCTGWTEDNGLKYYLREDGTLDECWKDTGDGLFYIVDGKNHTGWLNVPEGKFYFDSDGKSCSGWITDETGRFYLYGDGTYAAGFVEINGIERYFLPTGEYILLCNRWNPVPSDFENNLVSIGNYKIDATCKSALQQMLDDGNAAGHKTKILVSYRSKATQESLRASRRKKYIAQGMSKAEANRKVEASVAIPGTSEHQTGLAVDITGTKAMYDWLAKNSWKYGFILRYPDDKIDVTGIKYEPWHFRYVGKALAKTVYESGLCLEEYLEAQKAK